MLLHEAQFVAEHPLHADDEVDGLLFICPELSPMEDDLVTKPHFDIILERSVPEHEGHFGISCPITSVSKLFPHSLHLNSNIGIFFPAFVYVNF